MVTNDVLNETSAITLNGSYFSCTVTDHAIQTKYFLTKYVSLAAEYDRSTHQFGMVSLNGSFPIPKGGFLNPVNLNVSIGAAYMPDSSSQWSVSCGVSVSGCTESGLSVGLSLQANQQGFGAGAWISFTF